MSSFLFVIKTFILASLILFALQINVRNQTLESHMESFLTRSHVTQTLNEVAQGAVQLGKDGYNIAENWLQSTLKKPSAQQPETTEASRASF